MAFKPFTAIPQNQSAYSALINAAGQKRGINPLFLSSVIAAESSGNPNAVGPETRFGRARGLMQFMPATFGEISQRYDIRGNEFNPEANIEAGAAYLSELRDEFGNDTDALMAYNWGPGNVRKWIAGGRNPRQVPEETQNYVAKILGGAPSSLYAAEDTGAAVAGMEPQPTEDDAMRFQTASGPRVGDATGLLPMPPGKTINQLPPIMALQQAGLPPDAGADLLGQPPPGDMLSGQPPAPAAAEQSPLDAFMAKLQQPGARQALADAGAALLASSGWSTRPITMGEALGGAMQAGTRAFDRGQAQDMERRVMEAKLAQMETESASMAALRQQLGIGGGAAPAGGAPAGVPAVGGNFQTAAGPGAAPAAQAAAATPATFYDQASESEKLLLSAATTPQELAKAQHDIVTARTEASAAAQKLEYERGDKDFEKANTLRDDFKATTAFTEYNLLAPAYNQIQKLAVKDAPSGTDDLNMIYAYAKILDPNSVVREGEANFITSSVPGVEKLVRDLKGMYDEKNMLTPDIRADIARNAQSIFADRKTAFDTTAQRFRDIATRYKLDPDEVVLPEVTGVEPAALPERKRAGDELPMTPYQAPAAEGEPMLPDQAAPQGAPGDDAPVGTQWFFPGVGLMEMRADGWHPVGGE